MNDGMSNFRKWHDGCTRKSIFDPIDDHLGLITVLTAPRQARDSPLEGVFFVNIQLLIQGTILAVLRLMYAS